MRLIQGSCVNATMVAPRFSQRWAKRCNWSAASSRHRLGAARVLVHGHRRSRSIVSEGMGSSTEAPMLRRRYRRNRNFAFLRYRWRLVYTIRPLYFPREHFSSINRRRSSVSPGIRGRMLSGHRCARTWEPECSQVIGESGHVRPNVARSSVSPGM